MRGCDRGWRLPPGACRGRPPAGPLEALTDQLRVQEAGLADVAQLLDVSVVYVSDVERGNRRPFGNARIVKVAGLLGADPVPLIAAAAFEKGVIEFDITRATPLEAEVVGNLVSRLICGRVTQDQLARIGDILTESEGT